MITAVNSEDVLQYDYMPLNLPVAFKAKLEIQFHETKVDGSVFLT